MPTAPSTARSQRCLTLPPALIDLLEVSSILPLAEGEDERRLFRELLLLLRIVS